MKNTMAVQHVHSTYVEYAERVFPYIVGAMSLCSEVLTNSYTSQHNAFVPPELSSRTSNSITDTL